MSGLPTFGQALEAMQQRLQELPEMAPEADLPAEERVRRATTTFVANIDARSATYLESCIHCGHCAQACHFYLTTSDPRYTPVYKLDLFRRTYRREASPLRWFHRLFTRPVSADDLESWQDLVFDSCTMCGRCTMVCPMGIDIAGLVHTARGALAAAGLTPPAIRAIEAEQVGKDTVFGASPDKLREVIATLQDQEGIEIPLDRDRAEILVLTSGLDIVMNPRGILATAKVLNHLGVDWTLRSDGYESINFGAQTGNDAAHLEIARRRIETARACGAKTVLLCECGHTYPALRWTESLADGPLPFEVVYISEFLGREVSAGRLRLDNNGGSASFHDPCKTGRMGGLFEEPRAVLDAMGMEVREMPNHHLANFCCGGGGAVFLLQRAMPLRSGVYRLKLEQFEASGADRLVTACGSCRLNFATAAQAHAWDKPIQSLVELAADNLPDAGETDTASWRRPGRQ
jgi:Fe-S oxidoreductase